ncbi:CAP domain-containing protein [Streptococcus pseudopneumoniae]|uniref:Secretion protein n=1 Tax=Streptococcus pseudopneumoniae TaxID=257758 RepID=A0A3A4RQB7_9STRE|nr:CAP domain-containing protein [Streptococcus pseudopneumoniae]RJP77818.1 secretion protein [Streptococcus pseudopneumoniae]
MRQTNVRGSLSLRGFRKLRTGAIVATGVILLGLGFLAPTVSASEQDGVWVARTVEEVKADILNIDNLSHYTIKWGDTLSAISGATGLSVDSLVEINRIANRDLIFANNKLYFSEEAFLKDGNTEVKRQRVSIDNSGSRQSYEVETKTDTVTGEQRTTVKQTTPVAVEIPAASAEKAEESVLPASKSETSISVAPKAETRSETLHAPSADTTIESGNSTESSPVVDKALSNIGTTNQPVVSNPSSEAPAPKVEEPMVSEPKSEAPATPAPKVEEPVSPAPKAEEPATLAPEVEEPATPAPKADEPTVSEPKSEAPATPAPQAEAPAAPAPKSEAPVATRPTTEDPVIPKGEVPAVPQKEVQTVFKSEVSQASAGNVLVGIKGEFLTPDQQAILDSLNKIRKEAFEEKLVDKYVPIKWSTQLEKTALMRAAESSITNAHARLSDKNIWTAFPTGTRTFGENLAWNYKGFAEAIKQWYSEKADYIKKSKGETVAGQTGHYKSLINPLYTYTGLGAFNNPRHEHHWITVAQILGDKVDSEALVGQYGPAIQEAEVTESQLSSFKTKADIVENISDRRDKQ